MGVTEKLKTNLVRFLFVSAIIQLLFACSAPQHHDAIFFVTNTQVGLKIGSDEFQRPSIDVGYNRQEGAIVPVYIANSEKYIGDNDPFIQGVLTKAKARLSKNTHEDDMLAIEFIKSAKAMCDNSNPKSSPILLEINIKISGLKEPNITAEASKTVRETVCGLIDIELEKVTLVSKFNQDAKYIAKISGSEKSDAYSVFGTFSGSTGASSDVNTGAAVVNSGTSESNPVGSGSAKFNGSVAQSFATGIAAQIWASQGASVAGGVPKNEVIIQQVQDDIEKNREESKQLLEIVDKKVEVLTTDSEVEVACEKALAAGVLKPGEFSARAGSTVASKKTYLKDAAKPGDDNKRLDALRKFALYL